ncbi:MAG: AraC family transcriptional regulator ligand-binding domain-containing protein [Acidobacteria bacterium]|nr:AraC family transcriptional regulator ligand-binding domain-containing protein [Acidobacteriota bacterium]
MSATQFSVNPRWRVLLADLGIGSLSLLKRAKLPQDLFVREKASLTSAEYFRLWEALVEEAGDPLLPLRMGEAISTEVFDPPIFAAMCSPNLIVALKRIAKYKPLICPMRLHIEETTQSTRLAFEWLDKTVAPPAPLIAMELVFFVQLARLGTRYRVCPLEVRAPLRLNPADAYTAWFGVRVKPSEQSAISFRKDDALRPFLTANEPMWSYFEPTLQRNLDALKHEASMVERVHASLLELIPSGLASMDAVARKLGMSHRTLQRNLSQEGTRFQTVLASTRTKLAMHYLKSSPLSSAEIAFLLGFDDPNSFFRAFRTWTGATPEQVRATSQTNA